MQKITWATSFKQFKKLKKNELFKKKKTELLRLTYNRPKKPKNLLRSKNNVVKEQNEEKRNVGCR